MNNNNVCLLGIMQFRSLKKEVREISDEIEKVEDEICRINEKETLQIKVKGGAGGEQHFTETGMKLPVLLKKKALQDRKEILEEQEIEIFQQITEIQREINEIEDSEMRRIIRMRCIDGKPWKEIAAEMHPLTEVAAKVKFHRFFNPKK